MATDLTQVAERLRALGPELTDAAVPELVIAIREELRNTIAAGKSAEGETWALRKRGGQALQNAMDAVYVGRSDSLIVVRLTGVEARHHRGWAKGGTARPVIPTGELPSAWARAMKRVVDRRFREATRV